MKEEIIEWGNNSSCSGILTYRENIEYRSSFCAVFLNAGLIHSVGPNRMYVRIARKLADAGFHCFRFDFAETKVTGGKSRDEAVIDQIMGVFDAVCDKTKINQFVLIGMCSGAEDAFRTALRDERVVGLSLIDGIYQDKLLLQDIFVKASQKTAVRYYKKNVFSLSRWKKVIGGDSQLFSLANVQSAYRMGKNYLKRQTDSPKKNDIKPMVEEDVFPIDDWETLLARGVNMYLIFCEGGIAIDVFSLTVAKQLNTHKSNHALKIELINDVDHTFTPVWAQDLLIQRILGWVETAWASA